MGDSEDRGHLLKGEFFHVVQEQDLAVKWGECVDTLVQDFAALVYPQPVFLVGREVVEVGGEGIFVLVGVGGCCVRGLFELFPCEASPDQKDPCFGGRFAAIVRKRAPEFQKGFLEQIFGGWAVKTQAPKKGKERSGVSFNKATAGVAVALSESVDPLLFVQKSLHVGYRVIRNPRDV